ncbi:MAG: hypothetical protein HC867_02685 [Bacteroidia bacterium]|nr:hypothetical protein [Bacteroidia bacterium]
MDNLNVSPVSKLASVIKLRIMDEDPNRAEDILNELILTYNNAALSDKNTLAANTMKWVEGRLRNVSRHLDSVERQIQQYKASKDAIDIGSQGTLYLDNVSALNQRLGDVNVQMDVLDEVEKYVKSKDNASGIVPYTVGDPLLSQLVTKLYDAELEYDKLKKTTGENNPISVAKKQEIDRLRPSILESISNQRSSLKANKENLNTLSNDYSSMLSSIPKKRKETW